MGATEIVFLEEGYSIKEVYDSLVEEADVMDGIELYNGSINTCSLGGRTKRFDKFNKTNLKKAQKYIEDIDFGSKWIVDYIEFGVVGWDIIEVKKEVKTGKPKYEMKYVVKSGNGEIHKSFSKKTDADNFAMKKALKEDKTFYVEKDYVLVGGSSLVTEINKTKRRHKSKTKPKLKPKSNRKVVPVYKYMIYGKASI